MKHISLFIICMLIFHLLAYSDSKGTYRVIKDDINIRLDSTPLSIVIGKLNKGKIVEVIEEKYDWCKIKLPKGFSCYVKSEFVKKIEKNKAEVIVSTLNLRSAPSVESFVLGKAKKGNVLYIIEEENGWIKVNGYPYAIGWVHKQFLKKIEEERFVGSGKIVRVQQEVCNTNYLFKSKQNYPIIIPLSKYAKFLNRDVKIIAKKKVGICNQLILQKLSFLPKK
ncbi:MAG: SH3 domain-containing protein [Candidatus Omnitrophica bacterium]|nr:SH3 domain-containing protein [Candidatus Omnitrophota bacterium]